MLYQILKKDMLKRKGVNIILFLFITLSTVFLASSINNITIISSAVDYYMDYAHVPDVNIIIDSKKDKTQIDHWLQQQKEKNLISDFEYNQFLEVSAKSVSVKRGQQKETIENQGANLYLSTMDVDYSKVYDDFGNVPIVNQGEVLVSKTMLETEKLHIGEKITIQSKGVSKDLTIKAAVKDAAFGNEMVGISRFLLNEKDFQDYQPVTYALGVYYIMTPDIDAFTELLNHQGFTQIINIISIDTYKMVYAFDMIVAGLLIAVGICLICIALLVLRFTLVFSIEEQYQEIGILKAIGLKNRNIKKIYLIKYFVIVVVGAVLGTLLSIPVSQVMIQSVSQNMIMASDELNLAINIGCALSIIALVIMFCYLSTRKLNKVSAITAIRGGYTGERYHSYRGFHLSKMKYLSVSNYLGFNDITTHLTRYIVLIITFCLSFILITIPLNTINTMHSQEMLKKFSIDPNASVLLKNIEVSQGIKYHFVTDLIEGMQRVEKKMEDKGYQVDMTGEPLYFINYTDHKKQKNYNLMTLQLVGHPRDFLDYDEGYAPELPNEVAFSKDIMTENHWQIGDFVTANINGKKQNMIISGTFTDYMQLGKSARLNSQINCDQETMFDYWSIMVNVHSSQSQEKLIQTLQKEFPEYKWQSGQELADETIGGIQTSLQEMIIPMTILLCGVIMLITLLMEKLFITREKGEIAMLKSIGFQHKTIQKWQMMRMAFVVIVAMIVSIPLSLLSNAIVLKPIFAIMGAQVNIQVDPLQAYLIYPGILLIGIMISTLIATHSVKNINIREMNNLE